ncbi:MAG: hypothetical protein JOZ41_08330 [Chloroflexi bacterium]|nr:hypothetical protein [Chloroflexota bacterium]
MPTMANAQRSPHRSAPVVWLSNRMEIRLTARLNDDPSDIKSIPYVLHVPIGVKAITVAYAEGSLGKLESLTVIPDNPAGLYTSDTMVRAGRGGLTVTGATTLVHEATARTITATSGGTTNRHLVTRLAA